MGSIAKNCYAEAVGLSVAVEGRWNVGISLSKNPFPLASLVWANVLKKQKAASNMSYRRVCNTKWCSR